MKNFIFTLVTICFYISPLAQAPGYMGHRFSIEGDLNVLPWFTNALKQNKSRFILQKYQYNYYSPSFFDNSYYDDVEYEYNNENYHINRTETDAHLLSFNLKKSLCFNYSISSKMDISLKLEHTNSKFVLHNSHFESFNSRNPFLYSNNDQIHYNLLTYNLNFKFYKSNYIAPVGSYLLMGIGYARASSKYKVSYIYETYNRNNDYPNQYQTIFDSQYVKQHTSFIKINIGMGQKKFLTEKLYINTVIESDLYLLGKLDPRRPIIDYSKFSVFSYDKSNNIDDEIKNNYRFNIARHIFYDNLISFKIGLGLIL